MPAPFIPIRVSKIVKEMAESPKLSQSLKDTWKRCVKKRIKARADTTRREAEAT